MTFQEFFSILENADCMETKNNRVFRCSDIKVDRILQCQDCPFMIKYPDNQCSNNNRKKEYDEYMRVKRNLEQW